MLRRISAVLAVAVFFGGALACPRYARAQAITFTKVADTDTEVPGAPGLEFTSFGQAAMSGGSVAFSGEASLLGVYTDICIFNAGGESVVADETDNRALAQGGRT